MPQRQSVKPPSSRDSRLFWLFSAVLLLSLHQATILAYADFGRDAMAANSNQLKSIFIPNALILSYAAQLGVGKICSKIVGYATLLFFFQYMPALLYGCLESAKSRRRAALVIWILPALLGSPTIAFAAMYLISPLYAISFPPGFIFVLDAAGEEHIEDFNEGLTSMLAVVGWFHIFWLLVAMKRWLLLED